MTLEIPLTRGLVAVVDDADFDAVIAAGKWHATPDKDTFYARRSIRRDGKWRTLRMHTFLTGWSFVDHANGDGLDNRRSNLRPADASKNAMNKRTYRNNTSGYKGVSRSGPKWQAYIQMDGRQIRLGTFDTPQEAARAYDEAALALFGEFARPNFPKGVTA